MTSALVITNGEIPVLNEHNQNELIKLPSEYIFVQKIWSKSSSMQMYEVH